MTDIILCGCGGKMGGVIQELVSCRDDCRIVAGVDVRENTGLPFPVYSTIAEVKETANVVIDFSHPTSLLPILTYCRAHSEVSAVLCTTGYSQEQVAEINEASKELPLFYSRNMSLGINLLIQLVKKAEAVLGDSFDVEILEQHHNQKLDAPSGTALMIADAVNEVRGSEMKYSYDRHSQRKRREPKEIGIHSVRGGTIIGEHEVIFAGRDEVIKISHSAQSKELFAVGAVNAAVYMNGKQSGLYDMSNLV